jgi:hypothetical protein
VRNKATTIFDRRPKSVSDDQAKAWAQKKLVALREACQSHHGVAIEPYIKFLMKLGDELPTAVTDASKELERYIDAASLEGAHRHAARNAGVIYAGGCLAIDAGLLPWKKKRLLRAIATVFRDALREATQDGSTTRARMLLKAALTSADIVAATGKKAFGPREHRGFTQPSKTGLVYTVHAKVFRSWFDPYTLAAVLTWLDDEGFLVRGDRRAVASNGTQWAEQSPRWPNGQPTRSIVFRDPFPSRTKTKKGGA